MGSLQGRTVVVLGGSSGIGLATARAAQAEGAEVVITGRDAARLAKAKAVLGGQIRTGQFDAAHETPMREFMESLPVIDHIFSTAGTLVNDAGLTPARGQLRPAMGVRFWAALYACKYGAPRLRAAARRPLAGAAVASASCGAVESFARAMALDLAPVRVNVIAPGYVDTPLFDALLGEQRDAVLAAAGAKLPVGRVGRAEEIADAVLFLMKNEYVNGTTLTVDGGGLLV
ncbi:MAG: SDR family oxidoreductase [Gammaproteobacteria bacterium]|nr:SDR family oxidoreductase [Gammaproteobacteria bacterium]